MVNAKYNFSMAFGVSSVMGMNCSLPYSSFVRNWLGLWETQCKAYALALDFFSQGTAQALRCTLQQQKPHLQQRTGAVPQLGARPLPPARCFSPPSSENIFVV